MRHWIALAACLAAANAFAAAPKAPARAVIPILDAAAIKQACDDGLARHRKTIAAMDAKKGPAGGGGGLWHRAA